MSMVGKGWCGAGNRALETAALAGVSPIVPLDPHMVRDTTKGASAAMAFQQDKILQNGQTRGWDELEYPKACKSLWKLKKKDYHKRVKIFLMHVRWP